MLCASASGHRGGGDTVSVCVCVPGERAAPHGLLGERGQVGPEVRASQEQPCSGGGGAHQTLVGSGPGRRPPGLQQGRQLVPHRRCQVT
jgi:hypothetical protein